MNRYQQAIQQANAEYARKQATYRHIPAHVWKRWYAPSSIQRPTEDSAFSNINEAIDNPPLCVRWPTKAKIVFGETDC